MTITILPVKPLFVPLARQPFERFWDRVKIVEVRQLGRAWTPKNVQVGRRVTLSLGYGKSRFGGSPPRLWRLQGVIVAVATAPSVGELPLWAKEGAHLADVQLTMHHRVGEEPWTYFDPYAPVIAFQVSIQPGERGRA